MAILIAGCGTETVKVVRYNKTPNVTPTVQNMTPANISQNITSNTSNATKNVSTNVTANISSNVSQNVSSNTSSNISANVSTNASTHNTSTSSSAKTRNLSVEFIDLVGNSILIRTPTKKAILIDGGANSDGLRLVKYLLAKGLNKLDYVFDSNAENSNSGALSSVMFNFNESQAHITALEYGPYNYLGFRNYRNYAKGYGNPAIPIEETQTFDVENDFELNAYVPYGNMTLGTPKDDTIVYKLDYKAASFLFLSDCTEICWERINNNDMDADVLSVHGVVSQTVIDAVSPKIIVYDNVTADTIKPEGVKVYSKEQGTVIIMYDDEDRYLVSTTGKT